MSRLRGIGLVEALAALAIVGALLAALSGVLFQGAELALRQDRIATRADRQLAALRLIEARLANVVLVADPRSLRQPLFDLRPNNLRFVSRFLPPGPVQGLYLTEISSDGTRLTVTLSDWPDARDREVMVMEPGALRFEAVGMDALVDGLPRAVALQWAGGRAQLPLGQQYPLACVRDPAPAALDAGALACPGGGL
ncbi:hypothetical protein [uncultured Roseobacter sp.]|uniref:PulJ/GspJ family protein n=1 Tax=uncultured Roseobacter sp. TaxID=114847 RepID=UPI002617220C|nr:hypothetical protein [uncultured Roseobacter sp.]